MSVAERIEAQLRAEFAPAHLELVNESGQHNVAEGSESHFRLVLVSAVFDGMPRVRRHQRVYGLLREQLAGPVHALAIHAYTEPEWAQKSGAPESPRCLGGAARETGEGHDDA